MRTGGGIACLFGTLLLVSHAAADESPTSPAASETAPPVSQPGVVDRIFGSRKLGDVLRGLLSRVVDEQRDEFDRILDRYSKLVELTKRLERRDEAEFAARAERFEQLRLLTRKLEAEQAAREERDFEAHVDLVVRELAFTRELERHRAVSTLPAGSPASSDHSPLYERK